MSTSEPLPGRLRPASRRRLLAAAALAAAFALAAEAAALGAGFRPAPHPAWIAVIMMGARYGSGGFLAGVAAAAAGVALGAAIAGGGVLPPWDGSGGGADLVAFGACLGVAWVASTHLRTEAALRERIEGLVDRTGRLEHLAAEDRDLVTSLRARADRTSASLSFLRDAARRLEGQDPREAAEAAADLALIRTGASMVTVETVEGTLGRRLAIRSSVPPGERFLPETEAPSHAVSIRSAGDRVGVIALWGLPLPTLDRAAAHDLAVIASWCARAVAAARTSPGLLTGGRETP